jgi:hypothetical protein
MKKACKIASNEDNYEICMFCQNLPNDLKFNYAHVLWMLGYRMIDAVILTIIH